MVRNPRHPVEIVLYFWNQGNNHYFFALVLV
jgi:hypothetical protein